MQVNKPTATIIIAIVALLVIVLFSWPKYQEMEDLQRNLGQQSADFNGKSLYYQKINALGLQIKDRQQVLDKISVALPQVATLSPEMYFFQQAAAQNGLAIKSIVFAQGGPINATSTIKTILFSLDLSGSYSGLKNFLRQVEGSARIFQVNSISFNSLNPLQTTSQQNQSQIYHFKLEIKTHAY